MDGYRLWPEKTLTSPRGCHLGHHKAWLDFSEERESDNHDNPPISRMHFFDIIQMKLNAAIKLQHHPSRWLHVHMMFKPKDPVPNPTTSRLRILNHLDNELNLLRRILIAHRVMQHSESSGLLATEQWGGRKGKQCIDLALHSELLLHILHLSRTNASCTDFDAKACFDFIAPSLLSLAYSKGGASEQVTNLLGKALLRSRYYPTTDHGVSEKYNTHSPDSPFCGSGQGSCDGTASWVHTCNPCIKAYKERARGLNIFDPTGTIPTDGSIAVFVDDVKLFHNSPSNSQLQTASNTQHDTQLWTNVLWGSGGLANMKKTHTTPIFWEFNRHGHPKLSIPTDFNLTVLDPSTSSPYPLKTKGPKDHNRYLGVWKSCDLTDSAQEAILTERSTSFSNSLRLVSTDKRGAVLLYTTVFFPRIAYPSPCLSLSSKSCSSIESPAMKSLLRQVSLPQTFPRAILFAPPTHEWTLPSVPRVLTRCGKSNANNSTSTPQNTPWGKNKEPPQLVPSILGAGHPNPAKTHPGILCILPLDIIPGGVPPIIQPFHADRRHMVPRAPSTT